ncbi:MAG: hypothetical protein AAB784_01605 [Patescibacteria group bacterium]
MVTSETGETNAFDNRFGGCCDSYDEMAGRDGGLDAGKPHPP